MLLSLSLLQWIGQPFCGWFWSPISTCSEKGQTIYYAALPKRRLFLDNVIGPKAELHNLATITEHMQYDLCYHPDIATIETSSRHMRPEAAPKQRSLASELAGLWTTRTDVLLAPACSSAGTSARLPLKTRVPYASKGGLMHFYAVITSRSNDM
jgi:hypothetical protein